MLTTAGKRRRRAIIAALHLRQSERSDADGEHADDPIPVHEPAATATPSGRHNGSPSHVFRTPSSPLAALGQRGRW